MRTIAEYFHLERSQAELDFVDIPIRRDLPLFVDPYSFTVQDDQWSLDCNEAILSFFQTALDCITSGDHARGQFLLDNLKEPNETHLGLSTTTPRGRGVSGKQALDLYRHLRRSPAATTGVISELSDCDLFVEGIGPDKISDITTNIIRRQLVTYTEEQCRIHNIPTQQVPSDRLWNTDSQRWSVEYVNLPVIGTWRVLLVPKGSVRWSIAFSPLEYYHQFVLNFLQAEHLAQSSALVEVLKNGRRIVTKRSLEERYPFSKGFLTEFTQRHPDVLETYKHSLSLGSELTNEELEEGFDSTEFARVLKEKLASIPSGENAATAYHYFMMGCLEFLFYPLLNYPVPQYRIHNGRKIVDIRFNNAAREGFFFAMRTHRAVRALYVLAECKNYSHEIANPELDQIAGRFSPARGRLGLLLARQFDDRERFIRRCRDTVNDDRGFILPLVDADIVQLLSFVEERRKEELDRFLNQRFAEIVS